jgi:hypothetical protein
MTAVASASLFAAVDAAAGAEFAMSGRDDKTLLLVQNAATSAKTVTVKAGNGIQGVNDLTVSVPASSTTALVLDSGRYKNVSGDDRGKVIVMGASADIKLAVIVLP